MAKLKGMEQVGKYTIRNECGIWESDTEMIDKWDKRQIIADLGVGSSKKVGKK